jgi:hypothetical protein
MVPDPELTGRIAGALVRTLAELHAVDFRAAGLGDLGRPEGYAQLLLDCDGVDLELECDGEEDGTDTSLCTCRRDGANVDAVTQGLWPTESLPACEIAAQVCRDASLGSPDDQDEPTGVVGEAQVPEGCEAIEQSPEPGAPHSGGCTLLLDCDGVDLELGCDGEEDGTDTSLCTCLLDGARVAKVDATLWPTESLPACEAAASNCYEALGIAPEASVDAGVAPDPSGPSECEGVGAGAGSSESATFCSMDVSCDGVMGSVRCSRSLDAGAEATCECRVGDAVTDVFELAPNPGSGCRQGAERCFGL